MDIGTHLVLVVRLAAGILSIQDDRAPVTPQTAFQWALAADEAARDAGLDPFELIAIARNESDFRPNAIGPDGKDCGLTQTRVPYSRYRCRELLGSPALAFAEAARELSANQERCRKNGARDLARCRLNSYNSGVHYAREGWTGRYWLRIRCFAEAARAGRRPARDCRTVRSQSDITRLLVSQS